MPLNLVKLCVGAESLEDQIAWSAQRLLDMKAAGVQQQLFHTTRMTPRRGKELLEGGSLYWVIKGQIQARQLLVDLVSFRDEDGIDRCKLMLDNDLIPTQWQPKRAFQGWRYLLDGDAPPDLSDTGGDLPAHLRADLAELGLL